ncbi:MAG: O-antigen ligase family protein [Oscillospiraceae bacterium]
MKNELKQNLLNATVFKILFFVLALISFNGIFARRNITTTFAYIIAALGGMFFIYRLINYKKFVSSKGIFLLIAFCGSYALSSLVTRQYGLGENIQAMIWMVIQFFILYAYDKSQSIDNDKKELNIIAHFFMIYTFIACAVGIAMLITDYYSFEVRDETSIIMGFLWNRLWGLYTDPNYGAVFSVVTMVLSAFYFKLASKPVKAFYIVNCILQLLYIAFSDSRTGLISMFVTFFALSYLLLLRWKKIENKNVFLKGSICIALSLVVVATSFVVIKGFTTTGNTLKSIQYDYHVEHGTNPGKVDKDKTDSEIGRQQEDINGDVSNRRFSLWKSGLEIFATKPLTGISFRNYIPYAHDYLPETYIVNNDQTDFASMHNSFIDVLVSQGIIGVVIIALFISIVVFTILKKLFKLKGDDYKYSVFLLCSILPILSSMMFYSETFYMNTGGAVIFWLFLGYLMHMLTKSDKDNKLVIKLKGKQK